MPFKTILKSGLQASYNAIDPKDPDVLYFCTDTQKVYKGDVDYTNSVVPVATKPEAPAAGKVYVIEDTNTVEAYINSEWVVLVYPMATSISASSDNLHIATAKAVYDAISSLTSSGDIVEDVEAGESAAQLTIVKGDGGTTSVTVPGVVTTPSYDPSTRKITLPVTGGSPVEINLGKDIFIDPEADNGYNDETQCIELYLNDGTGDGKGTKIEIPASDLVDIYTGGTADGTSVTVDPQNVIKVNLVIDPDENNSLVLTSAGLKVDVSALTTSVSTLQTSVTTLTGNSETVGSVDYKIAQESATINSTITELASATTTWGTF